MSERSSVISFKKKCDSKGSKKFRSRRPSSSEDENENQSALEVTLEKQKLRSKSKGINALSLNTGIKTAEFEQGIADDPFKKKTEGLLDYKSAVKALEEESSGGIGTQFSKETRIRDEDEEMRKYIESEMDKISGCKSNSNEESTFMTPEDKAISSLPLHLKLSSSRATEEMLSSQMLSGIPEVDLGIDEKIRNIEATELAKKTIKVSGLKNDSVDSVNYRLIGGKKKLPEDTKKEETSKVKRMCIVGKDPKETIVKSTKENKTGQDPSRSTDDLAISNFKKQFKKK